MTQAANEPLWIMDDWTYRAQQRLKLLSFCERLRPDQDWIRLGSRAAANRDLANLLFGPAAVGVR